MRHITRDESRDTGMAMVLLLLIAHLAIGQRSIVTGAIVALVLVMTVPSVFGPVAVVWLGFSHLLGSVMSRVMLFLVFALVVTPMGVVWRWAGKDSLQLRRFKDGSQSVFVTRSHVFTSADLDKPY